VLVLEGARNFIAAQYPHTRNMRCAHDAATTSSRPYPEQEFWKICSASPAGRPTGIARFMIAESKEILGWVSSRRALAAVAGQHAQPSANHSFFLAAGGRCSIALSHSRTPSVDILYDAEVLDLDIDDGVFLSASMKQGAGRVDVRASTLSARQAFRGNIEC